MRFLLTMFLAFWALAAGPAYAVTYPPAPSGSVFDQADILPPEQKAALDAKLQEYSARTGRSIVVATVDSLEGETIEMYAVKLFENWGIGGKESDQGLLLLVAPNERKVRIEVGYGLHQYVTDALSGRIIRGEITPHFQTGDMAGGIIAGVDALITQLNRTPEDAKAIAEAAAAAKADAAPEGASAGSVIFWILLIVSLSWLFSGGRRGSRRSGINPGIVLWGASEVGRHWGGGGGGFGGGGGGFGGGGFGGFGGGGSGGGGASGGW